MPAPITRKPAAKWNDTIALSKRGWLSSLRLPLSPSCKRCATNIRTVTTVLGGTARSTCRPSRPGGRPRFRRPDQLPVQTDADLRVLKVSSRGLIAIRPIWVTVGKRYAGQSVTALLDGDHLTVYQADGTPIGHRRIDYTQPYRNNLRPAA